MRSRTRRRTCELIVVSALLGFVVTPLNAQQSAERFKASFTPAQLADRAVHRRAVEAVTWGMPAVNAELMFKAMRDCGSDFNQVVYWSRPLTWKNQTLTPNPDTIYIMPFYTTKDAGPIVLEIPPAEREPTITGSVVARSRRALQRRTVSAADRWAVIENRDLAGSPRTREPFH